MDKVTRQRPQTTTFLKRKESRSGIEPRSFRLPAYRLTIRPNRLFPLAAREDVDGSPGMNSATDRTTISGPRPRKEESAWAIFFILIFQQHSSSGLPEFRWHISSLLLARLCKGHGTRLFLAYYEGLFWGFPDFLIID